MVISSVRVCAWLELAVMLFQIFGVLALCLNRLAPTPRWAARGRTAFVVALLGLGFAGAFCGRHDSEFSLFAGGTMTLLLIGMTIDGGRIPTTHPANTRMIHEAKLAS